jgi:hypothetical protein
MKRSQASNNHNTNSNTSSQASSSSNSNSKSTSQMIEKSIRQGTGLVTKDILIDQSGTAFKSTDPSSNQNEIALEESNAVQNLPVPPPLPDFLIRPQTTPQFTFKVKTSCSNVSILNESTSVISNPEKDLHEKLIKEIHNKSLERSRKDSAICLDEHGNLICKPTNRIYNNSSAAKKLYKIKDNSSNAYLNGKQIQMVQKSNELTFKKSGFVKKAIDFNESKQFSNQNSNNNSTNTNSNNPNSIYSYNRALSQQIKPSSKITSTCRTAIEQQRVLSNTNQTDKRRNESVNDENDNVAEMISVSQIPTLERANALCDSSSELKKQFNEPRRATSFKSDLSNYSNTSSRSMLSEARAKLEAFSGKFSKLNSHSNASDTFIQQNSTHQPNFHLNNDLRFNDSNPAEHYYGEEEYLNTKF